MESGILETYAMGVTSSSESAEVEEMIRLHSEVCLEVEKIRKALEQYAFDHTKTPSPAIKPFLMAIIDYSERIRNGETPTEPPALHSGSVPDDYSFWLNRSDLATPSSFGDFHAKIIGYNPAVTTAIVWMRYMAPPEVHHNEYEKFLVLEGSCEIEIGTTVHKLSTGDFLSIPLHITHHLRVTSPIPCKVILQRCAA